MRPRVFPDMVYDTCRLERVPRAVGRVKGVRMTECRTSLFSQLPMDMRITFFKESPDHIFRSISENRRS